MSAKTARIFGLKALGAGKEVEDGQLAKINTYALSPLDKESVYVRKFLVAHNFLDRDNERFSDELLEDFAKTLPGKSLFVAGHPSTWSGTGGPGEGRFFDASTEEMTTEKFLELTGEPAKLPDGIESVKVLWGHGYMLRLDSNKDTLAKLDAGLIPFISIDFKAPWFKVTDEHGNLMYDEYRPNGEARGASLVWLGAQPGAGPQKQANDKIPNNSNGGKAEMDKLLKQLSDLLGKVVDEEGAFALISGALEEKAARIKKLEPLAKDGEAWRKSLVDDTMRFGAMIGEYPDDADSQKKEAEFVNTWPVERIKTLRDKYEKKAREQFPDKFTIKSKDDADRKAAAAKAKAKAKTAATGGKKDYSNSENNDLFDTLGS